MKLLNLMIRTVPSRVLSILYRQKAPYSATNLGKIALECGDFDRMKIKVISPEILQAVSLIKKYTFPIPWDEVTKSLTDGSEDAQKVILQSFVQLRDADIVMSYYKYFIDKGETFSELQLFTIIQALSRCPVYKILKYEATILQLYEQCKEYLIGSEIFQSFGIDLFIYFPYCFRDFVKDAKEHILSQKMDLFISRAFDFNDTDIAWELIDKQSSLGHIVLDSYINYCIQKALLGTFSVDDIHKFCDVCQRRGFIITSSDIICSIQPLINVLTYSQDEYVWSAKKCVVNPQGECLNCDTFLRKITITEDEFALLKDAVHNCLLFDKDVFLKTSERELNYFKYFLRNCKPYDLVIDGLNFFYRGIHSNTKYHVRHLLSKFVNDSKKRVLVIARKHSKSKKIFSEFEDAEFFYTDNLSEDDVFILYAAMQGGLGTGVVTCDFLNTHSAKLNQEMKLLFFKWQLSHQYVFDTKFGIVMPFQHLGLSQCTESPEMGGNSYKWHLSYQVTSVAPYGFRRHFDWLCLQAIPKKRKKTNSSQ